jgi:hypothetical protein
MREAGYPARGLNPGAGIHDGPDLTLTALAQEAVMVPDGRQPLLPATAPELPAGAGSYTGRRPLSVSRRARLHRGRIFFYGPQQPWPCCLAAMMRHWRETVEGGSGSTRARARAGARVQRMLYILSERESLAYYTKNIPSITRTRGEQTHKIIIIIIDKI